MGKNNEKKKQEDLLKTLGDFTSKENWDQFFSIRGSDDSFEWYAEWPQLKDALLNHLCPSSTTSNSEDVKILVPGCGNSKLSECLYDVGFRNITNIDFSRVAISDMLRRNVRLRPGMKWRVMDMTDMQYESESFDAVLDKGGLDALMEPELGSKLGNRYLSEVKRVLKNGGKFVCLTLAESHVLGLLFPKFRCGWKMSLHAIPQKSSEKSSLLTYMVIAEKDNSVSFSLVSSSIEQSSVGNENQARGLHKALETENAIRSKYSSGSDVLYSLEDLTIGAGGDLAEFNPGRKIQLTLGGPGDSRFTYRALLHDALQESEPFKFHYGVFLVPQTRAHEWLFSSEEGQWVVVDNSKAARLLMIFLDSSHKDGSMDDIQKDLSPLVKQLAPRLCESGDEIPFMAASDGIKERKIVNEVTSSITGPIVVDDVRYERIDDNISSLFPSKDLTFRRLTFQRTEGLIQSEALLRRFRPQTSVGETEQKKTHSSSKSRKKGNHRRTVPNVADSSESVKADHDYLASSYHSGIISGLMLISSYLRDMAAERSKVNSVVIGLGAGLLPMFLHRCLPILDIDVVELDSVVVDLARKYFDFREDEHLKVHVTDGIKYVWEIGHHKVDDVVTANKEKSSSSSENMCVAEGKSLNKIDVLIVDVDSSDSSSGLTCPASDFVEESFLMVAKRSLSEQGLFVINLVSRSPTIKDMVFSRMKKAFSHIFHLQLKEDVNEVIFALKKDTCIADDHFPEASNALAGLLKLEKPAFSQRILDAASKIKKLR